MRSRRPIGAGARAAALLIAAAAASCAAVRFRQAMNVVERRKAVLLDEFENGSEFAARDAARELEAALSSPAIARDPRFASDPEFERLLAGAIESVRKMHTEDSFQPDGPARFRAELLATCNGECHERFRAPD